MKINISGGEPFLNPTFLGEIIKYCKAELKLESTGIICNGSKVQLRWLEQYGEYLDIMGVSCDSFDDDTNLKIGRSQNGRGIHKKKVFRVAEWCRDRQIMFKMNTVVNRFNFQEDMNDAVAEIAPFRWKVRLGHRPTAASTDHELIYIYFSRCFKFCSWKARTRAPTLSETLQIWSSLATNSRPSSRGTKNRNAWCLKITRRWKVPISCWTKRCGEDHITSYSTLASSFTDC